MTTKKAAAKKAPAKKAAKRVALGNVGEQTMGRLAAALERIEHKLSVRDTPIYQPDAAPYPEPSLRIAEAIPATPQKSLGGSAPVSVLIDDVRGYSHSLRSRVESLRDQLVHGIPPDAPRDGSGANAAPKPSEGPSKDALSTAFVNMAATDDLIDEIERYLLNR